MRAKLLFAAAVVFGFVACGGPDPSQAPLHPETRSAELQLPEVANQVAKEAVSAVRVCPGPAAFGDALCHSLVVADKGGKPVTTSTPRGYGPQDLIRAYNLPAPPSGSDWSWNGQIIAIVDAYDDPYAESDLAVYRKQYGLPPCTAPGCFTKVDQDGGTSYPRANCGWAQEISLDLDMASAICPMCKILLVEASSNSFANLATAVDTAVRLGATVISNSYGGAEFSSELDYAGSYGHAGAVITASSGDGGYGVEVPAAYGTVVAVGGTSLHKTVANGGITWTETVWSGSGSGCSKYVTKPSWQQDAGCTMRTVADVAAVADPNTGVAVYDSFRCQGASGWLVFGGTSVSSPIIAATYALAGNASTIDVQSNLYASSASLFDVTSGSNGSCGGSYLCTATTGYDGPTGNGTPNGITAF